MGNVVGFHLPQFSLGAIIIALPVVIAPSGRHRLCHEEGERATARAARAAGSIYTMSSASSFLIEEIAPDAGPWWFQLYVFTDRGFTRDLVARAAAAGAAASGRGLASKSSHTSRPPTTSTTATVMR